MSQTQPQAEVEDLDVLPLLDAFFEEIELRSLLEAHFPVPHPNWTGLTPAQVMMVWFCYVVDQLDHRLCPVSDWVRHHPRSLAAIVGAPVRPEDLCDDKLGYLLDVFARDQSWETFEAALNQRCIRLYALDQNRLIIQLDPTVGQVFRQTVEGGLCQYGHAKQHRGDLPQFKSNVAMLAGIGMLLATLTVPGHTADDGLYLPLIEKVRASLGPRRGVLWCGDVKMASMSTRAALAQSQDYYLCPLSRVQMPAARLSGLLQPVHQGQISLQTIKRHDQEIAEGFEVEHEIDHQGVRWRERWLVVRSPGHAHRQKADLHKRLDQAREALESLNKGKKGRPRPKDEAGLRQKVADILAQYRVEDLLEVDLNIAYHTRKVRAYKDRPAREEQVLAYQLEVRDRTAQIAQRLEQLGWRVYACNVPRAQLSLEAAIAQYREEYQIERRIRNLKEEVTKLMPVYVHKDERLEGLIRWLSLVMKGVAAIEWKIAQGLKARGEELAGVYAGNPRQSTPRPTMRKIVAAMKGLRMVWIWIAGAEAPTTIHPDLGPTQHKLIEMMGVDLDRFYQKLEKTISFSP